MTVERLFEKIKKFKDKKKGKVGRCGSMAAHPLLREVEDLEGDENKNGGK